MYAKNIVTILCTQTQRVIQRRCIWQSFKNWKWETKGGAVCAMAAVRCVFVRNTEMCRALSKCPTCRLHKSANPHKRSQTDYVWRRGDEPMRAIAMSPPIMRQCLSGLAHAQEPTQSHHTVNVKYRNVEEIRISEERRYTTRKAETENIVGWMKHLKRKYIQMRQISRLMSRKRVSRNTR